MSVTGFVFSATLLVAQAQQPPSTPPAQAAPPSTEVYVASLSISGTTFTVGQPQNVSNGPGYDNQPFFTPDGASLLFTSDQASRSDGAAAGRPQTDVFRYDFASGRLTRVTTTAESEYSPTVTPDGKGFSVIQVEKDQTQRLWRFTLDGKNPTVVLQDIKPVGYHAWLDDHTLALFVLGSPATLQVADTRTGKAEIVSADIGQSVVKMPGGAASFVQQGQQGSMISQISIVDGKPITRTLTAPVPGARQVQLAWTPDGTLLMAHSGWLHAWKAGDSAWRAVVDLEALGLKGVTRLAVSPKGDRIALVAQ